MTIFDQNGHITTKGLFLLITEKADEMQRLELSEHLSFCDRCLEEYLEELEKVTLLESENNISKSVIKRVKYKTAWLSQKRFGTVVAAAGIAMLLWTSGAFSWEMTLQQTQTVGKLEHRLERMSWKSQNMLHDMSQKYQYFLNKLDGREEELYGKK